MIAFLSFDTSLLEFQQKCGSSVALINDGGAQVPENCFLSLDIRLVYLYPSWCPPSIGRLFDQPMSNYLFVLTIFNYSFNFLKNGKWIGNRLPKPDLRYSTQFSAKILL